MDKYCQKDLCLNETKKQKIARHCCLGF